MPQVFNKRQGVEPRPPAGAVYVGRPSIYGNPFVVGVHGEHGECVKLYRDWINADEQKYLRQLIQMNLKGKDLVCWCKPKECHADIILEIANGDIK